MSDMYFYLKMDKITGDLYIEEVLPPGEGFDRIWSAGTSGMGNLLSIQGNNLVVLDISGNVLWSSDSNDYGEPAARVAIQLNHNLDPVLVRYT